MTRVDAPKHLLLYCRRCDRLHPFHLRNWSASYYGDCIEVAMPESILNQALGFEITVLTLLAQYSSVIEFGVEELLMPLETLL